MSLDSHIELKPVEHVNILEQPIQNFKLLKHLVIVLNNNVKYKN